MKFIVDKYVCCTIAGGHINPAVTFGMFVARCVSKTPCSLEFSLSPTKSRAAQFCLADTSTLGAAV